MRTTRWVLVFAAVLAACAAEPMRSRSDKPTAPVQVDVDVRDLGGRRYEVRVHATPTANVDALDVTVQARAGATLEEVAAAPSFGRTESGRTRTLVRHVRLADAATGADVVADARVTNDAVGTRNRSRVVRVGALGPVAGPKPATTITLPNGDRVDEVRP